MTRSITDLDVDELAKELELQESVVKAKEEDVIKWRLILETQRENIDKDVKKYQSALADATKASQEKHDQGARKWHTVLTEATEKRNKKYEEDLKRWQNSFDNALSTKQFKQARQAWHQLEASRRAPTKEMEQASERLKQLEELADVPTKAMKEPKQMIDQLKQQRDVPTKHLTLTTKYDKKYVKDVMKWQHNLADATARHERNCKNWAEAFRDSQRSNEMRQVRNMLRRLIATSEVPSEDMEKAIKMLERLEEEKDAHAIVMRHAGSQVYKLEKELLKFKVDLNLTKKLIRQRVDSVVDYTFSDESGTFSYDEGEQCFFNWMCSNEGVVDNSVG
jgi:tetratricopeptide (TPR) repeat protein